MINIQPDRVRALIAKSHGATLVESDFKTAIEQPIQTELSPWELWALVAFLRHERRQKWVGFIVESKLKASGQELGTMGSLGHPESGDDDNTVPDLPGWRYRFHGGGCCLTHDDGTTLDVDFNRDGSALEIDPYFFQRFLETAANLEWSDARLRYPAPLENTWQFDLRRLAALGLIRGSWQFCLTDEGRTSAERFEPLVDEINRAVVGGPDDRLVASWLVALTGDTPEAIKLLGNGNPTAAAALRSPSTKTLQARVEYARRSARSSDENERRLALTSLAALGREHAEPDIWDVLNQKPPCSVHLVALRLVESWRDPRCEPQLITLLEQYLPRRRFLERFFKRPSAEPKGNERPRNALLVAVSRVVITHNTPTTISPRSRIVLIRTLEIERTASDAEAGFLLHLLEPSYGVAKIAANLRNRVPDTRSKAAIFLGMIGTAEAIRALIDCAEGPAEDGGHEAACVLSMLDTPIARAVAEQWSRRNDGYEDAEGKKVTIAGRTITAWKMDELIRASMREEIQYDTERLRREYGPLLARWIRTA